MRAIPALSNYPTCFSTYTEKHKNRNRNSRETMQTLNRLWCGSLYDGISDLSTNRYLFFGKFSWWEMTPRCSAFKVMFHPSIYESSKISAASKSLSSMRPINPAMFSCRMRCLDYLPASGKETILGWLSMAWRANGPTRAFRSVHYIGIPLTGGYLLSWLVDEQVSKSLSISL